MWSWSLTPGCFVCYAKHMLSHWAVPQPLLLLLKSQLAVGIIQFEICQLNKWYHILIYYSYFSPEWWNVSASSKIVSLGILEIIYTQCKHFHDKMNELKTFFLFSSLFSVYVCAFLCTTCSLQRPEEGVGALGAGVTVGCNPPNSVSTGNQTQVLSREQVLWNAEPSFQPLKSVFIWLDNWKQEPSTSPLLSFALSQ